MVETFVSVNSTYEIDRENKKVRRLSGENSPTPHLDPDGDWHDYDGIHQKLDGGYVFYWPDKTCTVTSMSKEMYDRL